MSLGLSEKKGRTGLAAYMRVQVRPMEERLGGRRVCSKRLCSLRVFNLRIEVSSPVPLWQNQVSLLRQLRVDRIHYTVTIVDSSSYREDYRYVFTPVKGLRILPLSWRLREVQANMLTTDASGRNLVYLPSFETEQLSRELLQSLMNEALAANPVLFHNKPDGEAKLLRVAEYQLDTASSDSAQEIAHALLRGAKGSANESVLRRLALLVDFLCESYIPFVELPDPAIDAHLFVRHGVDMLVPIDEDTRPSFSSHRAMRRLKWIDKVIKALTGFFPLEIQLSLEVFQDALPWAAPKSLHVKVTVPLGTRLWSRPRLFVIDEFPSPLSEETEKEVLKHAARDNQNLYIYFRADAGLTLVEKALRDCEVKRTNAQTELLSRKAERLKQILQITHKPVKMTLSPLKYLRNFMLMVTALRIISELLELSSNFKKDFAFRKRVSARLWAGPHLAAYALLAFMWVPVVLGYALGAWGTADLNVYAGFLGVLFLVVLTDVVYVMDKPLLTQTVLTHASIATALVLLYPMVLKSMGVGNWLRLLFVHGL